MILSGIRALGELKGSSRHAIFKWIQANHGPIADKHMSTHGNLAIKNGLKSGLLKTGKTNGVYKVGDKQKENEKVAASKVKAAAKAKVAKAKTANPKAKAVAKPVVAATVAPVAAPKKKAAPAPKKAAQAPKKASAKKPAAKPAA